MDNMLKNIQDEMSEQDISTAIWVAPTLKVLQLDDTAGGNTADAESNNGLWS